MNQTAKGVMLVLAAYRLAQLFPEDDGPFFIFTRLRSFVTTKMVEENEPMGRWNNLHEGINCVYCCGIYAAILITMLIIKPSKFSNVFLTVFAIAGGQSFLQRIGESK
jgi:hypothetical protein